MGYLDVPFQCIVQGTGETARCEWDPGPHALSEAAVPCGWLTVVLQRSQWATHSTELRVLEENYAVPCSLLYEPFPFLETALGYCRVL